jgi:hypothetical protein
MGIFATGRVKFMLLEKDAVRIAVNSGFLRVREMTPEVRFPLDGHMKKVEVWTIGRSRKKLQELKPRVDRSRD